MAEIKSIWSQPPSIRPNYGKPKSLLPKSNLTRVLLHDNVNHEHLLQVRNTVHVLLAKFVINLIEYILQSISTLLPNKHGTWIN